MATTPGAYRKKRMAVIEIPDPSGGEPDLFKIKAMASPVLAEFLELFEVPLESGDAEAVQSAVVRAQSKTLDKETYIKVLEIIFPMCIIEPKVVKGDGDEHALGVNEISESGILLDEIFALSGLTEEAAERRKSFRRKQIG